MKHLAEKMDLVARNLLNEAPKEDPKENIRKHSANAQSAISKINKYLSQVSKNPNANWADEGSLAKVTRDLEELARFTGVK